MLHLLLGTDWTANRDAIMNLIAEDVKNKKSGRILMVPELISHDTERRLCAVAGDSASLYAEVLSFTRLARRVSDYAGIALQECLDNGGRVVAMASAARQIRSQLKAYASVETRPEFLSGLIEAIDEFKRCCITSDDLLSAAKQTEGVFAQKLEELSYLYSAYDGLCARGKRDPRDQLTWLLEELEESSFAENHAFYFDGFDDFSQQQIEVVSHLICNSSSVVISLNCDKIDTNLVAFERAAYTASTMLRIAKDMGVEIRISHITPSSRALRPICDRLFQGSTQGFDFGDKLSLYRAESIHQECVAAAERIIECVQQGARYRDIGVVCSDMEVYRNAINMVFHRCGIPVYLSGTEDVLSKSVITTVVTALDVALSGFDQRDVIRYLRSSLSPVDQETCDLIENYAVLWSIDGNRWKEAWESHPAGLGEAWDEKSTNLLIQINNARETALRPLIALQEGCANAHNLAEQVDALYAFFESISLKDRLQILADRLDAKGDYAQAQVLNQLWDILLNALEQMRDILGGTVWDTDTYVQLFKLLLSQYDVGTIPPVLDAVTVGPVNFMRCHETKHLIIIGALEGAFPSYGKGSGVLSNQEREQLRQMGVTLNGGSMEMLQTEFAEIYGVFCGAGESITASCPSGQPSFVYRRLAELAGGDNNRISYLGAALVNKEEAGAYLARWDDADAAEQLGISSVYDEMVRRRDHRIGIVDPENIKGLYGSKLRLSASQVDRQAECRLSYFLKYGLRAKELKPASIDPAEFGTFVHAVLEQTVRKVMELGGFQSVSIDQILEISRGYAERYARERFSQIDTQRLSYLFRRNGQELDMIVQELWNELMQSSFVPAGFEVAFGGSGDLPAIDISGKNMDAQLMGFVDRVDVWKENNVSYYRVVDYKTGKKDFDYCDVFNGIGLQMLLYMFALENSNELLDEGAMPAGVQYFPARVPMVSADGIMTDEEAAVARDKNWKRSGLLLNDGAVLQAMEPGEVPKKLPYSKKKDGSVSGDLAGAEQFDLLKKYVYKLLGNMVDEIASGNVSPNPYTRGSSHNACTFCPYTSVCNSNCVDGRRNYRAMSSQQFWEYLGKELSNNG